MGRNGAFASSSFRFPPASNPLFLASSVGKILGRKEGCIGPGDHRWAFSTLQGCGSVCKQGFRRVIFLLQKVLRCFNSSFRFPIGLSIEGDAGNVFKFPAFGKFSKLGWVVLGAVVRAYHFRYTTSGKHRFEGTYRFRRGEGWQVTDLDELSGTTLGIMSSFFVNSSFSSLRHCFTRPSIWRLRPGHHSALFALALHFVTPWWPSCTRSSISKLMAVGITIRSAFRSNPWTIERSSLVCQ